MSDNCLHPRCLKTTKLVQLPSTGAALVVAATGSRPLLPVRGSISWDCLPAGECLGLPPWCSPGQTVTAITKMCYCVMRKARTTCVCTHNTHTHTLNKHTDTHTTNFHTCNKHTKQIHSHTYIYNVQEHIKVIHSFTWTSTRCVHIYPPHMRWSNIYTTNTRHATISWGESVFFKRKSVSIRIIHQCIDVSPTLCTWSMQFAKKSQYCVIK